MHAKFEGNLITSLHCFASVQKKGKMKKMSNFLKAYFSGIMAGIIYFRYGMCSVWHLHSKFSLVWTRDHGATVHSHVKSYFVFMLLPHFLELYDTLLCVLNFINLSITD